MDRIALFGAAGAIGKSIADALRLRGRAYRVVGRNRHQLEQAFVNDPLAEIVTWDPDDPASIRAAAKGIDTLIYLVGIAYHQFHLHPPAMRRTLEAAIAEGVKRIVLIGNVYPYGLPSTPTVSEEHPRNPHTFKGKMRMEQEDILLQAHVEGKIQATILRLPDFYGPGVEASYLHSLFKAAANGGTADMVGPIDRPHEFVFVPDVGPVVLDLAETPAAYGRFWNFAGAGSITQREIATKAFAMTGRKPKIRIIGKTLLRLIGIFKPFMREMVEMHYLFTTPLLLDDRALAKLLGNIKKTPYDEGIKLSIDAERSR